MRDWLTRPITIPRYLWWLANIAWWLSVLRGGAGILAWMGK